MACSGARSACGCGGRAVERGRQDSCPGGGDAPPSTARLASSWGTGRGPARGKVPLPLLLTELRVFGTASDGANCHTVTPVRWNAPHHRVHSAHTRSQGLTGWHWVRHVDSRQQQRQARGERGPRSAQPLVPPCSLRCAERAGKRGATGWGSPRGARHRRTGEALRSAVLRKAPARASL